MSKAHEPLILPKDVNDAADKCSETLHADFSDYSRRAESLLTGLGNLGVIMAFTQIIIDSKLYPLPNIASWAVSRSETPPTITRDLVLPAKVRDSIMDRAAQKGHSFNERMIRSLRLMNYIQKIKPSHEVDVLHDQKRYVFIFYL